MGRELWPPPVAMRERQAAAPCSGRDGVKAETERQLLGNFFFYGGLIKHIPSHRVSRKGN